MEPITLLMLLVAIVLLTGKTPKKMKKKLRPRYGEVCETLRGERVRSVGERRIADTLTELGLEYRYNHKLDKMRCDFYLPQLDIYIEYWGLVYLKDFEGAKYRKRMKDKQLAYKKMNKRLIEIYPEQIYHIKEHLSKHLFHIRHKPMIAAL